MKPSVALIVRFLGISGHYHGIMETAIDIGLVDLIMLPVNMLNHAMPGRGNLLELWNSERVRR